MYRVAGLLLIWLAGAEETEDCAMTQLRGVNEHHQVDSEETTDERSQSAKIPFQNMCPIPCVKDEAMKTCKQNKGYSFKTDTCSFKCNGKGKVQNWKGPALATLVKNPCKDTTNGPAAFCKKNPSESYDDATCGFKCLNGQALSVSFKSGSYSIGSSCIKKSLFQASSETHPAENTASHLADEDDEDADQEDDGSAEEEEEEEEDE